MFFERAGHPKRTAFCAWYLAWANHVQKQAQEGVKKK